MSASPVPPAPDPPDQPGGLAKGATIGRYVVLGLLGRGGMGEVYAAYDPELDRKIAVKLLRARGSDPDDAADGKTRLLREAQAIARLSHPNVVVVYDVGTFRDSVFVAMEFVEGSTVGYWLAAQPRRWREVLDVFLAAGRGLVAAHEAGIVHRDFKPENVMLTRDGQVRVMDFGLARQVFGDDDDELDGAGPGAATPERALAASLAPRLEAPLDPDATANLSDPARPAPTSWSGGYLSTKLTQTGALLGTPAYMAPEQFAGARTDTRTDQFSFCVALYEGLYGARPFPGNTPVELMASVLEGRISDPPADSHVPAWLRKILLRALRPDPESRWPSMVDLLAALARDPAVRRRRWMAGAAGVIFLVGAASNAYRLSSGRGAVCAGGPARAAAVWGPAQRDAIRRAFVGVGAGNPAQAFAGAAALIDRYVGRWTAMYTDACEATQIRGEQSAEVLDLRMTCLGERLAEVRALTGVFAGANSRVVENAVSAAGGLPDLDRCADVAMLRAVIKPPDDPITRARVAAIRDDVAKVHALATSGQCDRATAAGTAVVAAAAATGYLPLQAEALFAVGRMGDNCTDPSAAIERLEEAVYAAEASHHDEIAIQASVYLAGDYADRAHEVRLGRHWVRHAEAIFSNFAGHPLLGAWIANAKGLVLRAEGNHHEALREQQRALSLKEAALGRSHVDSAISALNVALTLHELGRDGEAEPIIRRVVDIFTNLLGPDSAQLAVALLDQSEILTALGSYDAAQAAVERALAIWQQRQASPLFTGHGLLGLGRVQIAQGNVTAARATLEQAVEMLRGADDRTAADAEFALARALWSSPRDRARAVTLARKARGAVGDRKDAARKASEIDAWLADRRPR